MTKTIHYELIYMCLKVKVKQRKFTSCHCITLDLNWHPSNFLMRKMLFKFINWKYQNNDY